MFANFGLAWSRVSFLKMKSPQWTKYRNYGLRYCISTGCKIWWNKMIYNCLILTFSFMNHISVSFNQNLIFLISQHTSFITFPSIKKPKCFFFERLVDNQRAPASAGSLVLDQGGHAHTCKQWDYEIWDGLSLESTVERLLRGILTHMHRLPHMSLCVNAYESESWAVWRQGSIEAVTCFSTRSHGYGASKCITAVRSLRDNQAI